MPSDNPLFPLGIVAATPAALSALEEAGVLPITLLARHQHGDWGDMSEHDRKANDFATTHEERVFSAYQLPNARFFVITEADRASTTILLSREY